jgi:hypothetical protein
VTRTRAFAAALAGASLIAAAPGAAFAAADLSGFWLLQTDPADAPAASLTPAGAKALKEITSGQGLDAKEGSPEYARIWCTVQGMPWQMTYTLPLDIRQSPIEVTILPSVRAESRHIYTDGQRHPDPETYDPTTVGHSIGRWQGDTLVVDTIGFSDKGVLVIPGGAVRTPKSHLVERYRLDGPDTLRVTYTWTDPQTLRRPHSYTQVYARAKGPVWMTEPNCNPIRAMRAKGLPLPPDAPPG